MAASNINRVVITGNLTFDPELKQLQSGTSVCRLRVAVNTRAKVNGEWADKPNYFDVTVWGSHGENCAKFLSKGKPVAIDGRLEWREWEQDGSKRSAVQIVADTVQFLGGRDSDAPRSEIPVDASQFTASVPAATADEEIPFLWDGPPEYMDRYHQNRGS